MNTKFVLSSLLFLLTSQTSQAQGDLGGYRPTISREFLKEQSSSASGFEILNRSIQNHAIANSLAANAGEINRTVESLMQSLFYSIMDQRATLTVSDTLKGGVDYQRVVQATGIGTYVVFDKFRIGPEIIEPLGNIKGLPLTFRDQNKLFLTNVSYRSDAQRKANAQTRSGWREWANNWFGALPFLTRILPPSFNPEELYDPISYLGTPFLFPKNAEQALQMPLGTVRSYGLAGSAGAGIDAIGRTAKDIQESLNLGDLQFSIPFGPILESEHQISILHTRDDEVWLAVSEIRQLGAVFDVQLGKRYPIFKTLVGWWTGSIATIAPIDYEIERSKIMQKDDLFTFDLSKKDARDALNKALNGDVSMAKSMSSHEVQAQESGVHFQFRRNSVRGEDSSRHARSFFVAQSQKRARVNDGESIVTENDGDTVTLEAEHAIQNRDWNVLTGVETVDVNFRFGLPVLKKVQDGKSFYKIIETPEPNYLVANLRIIDRFQDTRDYAKSIKMLREFSSLKLEQAPTLPIYAKDREEKFLREQAFLNPMDNTFQKDVPPTHLGRFEAYAHVYINQNTLKNIGRLDPAAFWRAYAQAFGYDHDYWSKAAEDKTMPYYFNWLGSYAVMPLRLVNMDSGFSDYVYEGQGIKQALEVIANETKPEEILKGYRALMDTNHPAELLHALNILAPVEIPAVVGFTTSPDNNKNDTPDTTIVKKAFGRLNNRKIQTQARIPVLKRNQSAEEKLAAFTPGGYHDESDSPDLRVMTLSVRTVPPDPTPRLLARVEVTGTDEDRQGTMQGYVRVEENGPLQLGRFVLNEEVRDMRYIGRSSEKGEGSLIYELDLSGPNGLSKSDFFDKAFKEKGAFNLYFSVSNHEDNWGQEQKISFDIQNGLLKEL
ncbi:MAG: hypothetical protein H7249_08430 [Chitinophagaceae bacterium]|nr:hypothetical protein [Oligoflexus sp.]